MEQGGRRFRGWNIDRYMMKASVDAERAILYVTRRANGGKDAKPPEPIPSPDDAKKQRAQGQNAFAAMAAQRLAAARDRAT